MPSPCSALPQEDDVIGLLSSADVSQLKPLQDRVLIEVLEAEAKTKGGLVLTEGAKEKPTMGKVGLAGGRGAWGGWYGWLQIFFTPGGMMGPVAGT